MKSTTDFRKMKKNQEKITMATAYDYPSARLVEDAGMDIILVGDSVGNTVLGYESTISVTLEDMILHTKAVTRGVKDTFIVADMPFMTYHTSTENTLQNAKRLVQEGGARAVKLEGAGRVTSQVERLTLAGVPVVSHLGLTPQMVEVFGGYQVQGKTSKAAKKLVEDALQLEAAGAFMIVLECVPKELAAHISQKISIPTIGIGAGNETDGQVLVYHDIIGYTLGHVPKFVKPYANVAETIQDALKQYAHDVKTRDFPDEDHSFTMKKEEIEALLGENQ